MVKKSRPASKNAIDYSGKVSTAVINRLPRYYRYLSELLKSGRLRISSGELSELMNVTASQIRQDLNCFGGFGQQGYGYNVKFLYSKISEILGVTKGYRAIIIGTGNLGQALAGNPMFEARGVKLTALFDIDPSIIGQKIAGMQVLDMSKLDEYCEQNKVDIAVLSLPRESAKKTAEHLAHIGIRGLWNFTNMEFDLSGTKTRVQNVHLGDLLMTLCYAVSSEEEQNIKTPDS